MVYFNKELREYCPTRPEGAEALSPGQRPGLFWTQTCRPVRAKALKLQAIYKAFALTGRLVDCQYTQGVALGWGLLPFQGVLLVGAVELYLCFTLRPAIFNSLRPVTVGSGRAAYMSLGASFRTELLTKLE